MEQLANALRREHGLLEMLLFKLVETQLLLVAGEVRFLPRSTEEVERARQRAREADLVRAAVAERDRSPGLDGGLITLRALAGSTHEPWAGILRDHRESMCALVAEIEWVGHQNSRQAHLSLQRTEVHGTATAGPGAGDRHANTVSDLALMRDRAAFEAVLGTAARLRMPALLTFLR